MSAESFDSWAIVELMGHVRMAGRVTEEERFGSKMGRVDVPNGEGFVSVYFTASSVYRLTPVSEEVARSAAAQNKPRPVHQWELPKPEPIPVKGEEPEDIPFDGFDPDEGDELDPDSI